MNLCPYDASIDQLLQGTSELTIESPLSFITEHVDSVLNNETTHLEEIPKLITKLNNNLQQLSGEELLISLLCLFQSSTVIAKTNDQDPIETGLKVLTLALCRLLPTFFSANSRPSFHSLFGNIWWIQNLREHLEMHPENFTPEYCLEAWFLVLKNDIPKRKEESYFEQIELPNCEITYSHPHNLSHSNTFHEWHALCYWLSQVVYIDPASHKVIFETYLDWKNHPSINKETLPLVEGGLSYLIAFFEEKYPLNASKKILVAKRPLSFMEDCDLTTWLQLPLSCSLGVSLQLQAPVQEVRVHELMQKTIVILNQESSSHDLRFEAAADALCVNMALTPTLLDIHNLFNAINRIQNYCLHETLLSRLIYCYARAIKLLHIEWKTWSSGNSLQRSTLVMKNNIIHNNNMFLEEITRLYLKIADKSLKNCAFESIWQLQGCVLLESSEINVVKAHQDTIYVGNREAINSLFTG